MKLFLSFLISIFCISTYTAQAQDTIFYNKEGDKVAKLELAEKYTVIIPGQKRGIEIIERTYFKTGQIKSENLYSDYKEKDLEGVQTTWNENGEKYSESTYKNGKRHGTYVSYWPNGKVRRTDHYKKGDFTKGKVWDSTGVQVEYFPQMERAEFPGGQEALAGFLKANITNPNGLKGRIVVKFVVGKAGNVTTAEIMESNLPQLNEEALRIVYSMPLWKPGKHEGEPVNVFYALPLVFQ